jgi:hypothetical protein
MVKLRLPKPPRPTKLAAAGANPDRTLAPPRAPVILCMSSSVRRPLGVYYARTMQSIGYNEFISLRDRRAGSRSRRYRGLAGRRRSKHRQCVKQPAHSEAYAAAAVLLREAALRGPRHGARRLGNTLAKVKRKTCKPIDRFQQSGTLGER